jgi:hypothetical protein
MLKNKRRGAESVGLPAVLALLTALLPGGTAQADKGGAPIQAACTRVTNVGLTIHDGNFIRGSGSANLCGSGYLVVTVQRLRAWGWQSVGAAGQSESGAPVSAVYDCTGTGTFTYRTQAWQRVPLITGQFVDDYFNYSNKIRVSC